MPGPSVKYNKKKGKLKHLSSKPKKSSGYSSPTAILGGKGQRQTERAAKKARPTPTPTTSVRATLGGKDVARTTRQAKKAKRRTRRREVFTGKRKAQRKHLKALERRGERIRNIIYGGRDRPGRSTSQLAQRDARQFHEQFRKAKPSNVRKQQIGAKAYEIEQAKKELKEVQARKERKPALRQREIELQAQLNQSRGDLKRLLKRDAAVTRKRLRERQQEVAKRARKTDDPQLKAQSKAMKKVVAKLRKHEKKIGTGEDLLARAKKQRKKALLRPARSQEAISQQIEEMRKKGLSRAQQQQVILNQLEGTGARLSSDGSRITARFPRSQAQVDITGRKPADKSFGLRLPLSSSPSNRGTQRVVRVPPEVEEAAYWAAPLPVGLAVRGTARGAKAASKALGRSGKGLSRAAAARLAQSRAAGLPPVLGARMARQAYKAKRGDVVRRAEKLARKGQLSPASKAASQAGPDDLSRATRGAPKKGRFSGRLERVGTAAVKPSYQLTKSGPNTLRTREGISITRRQFDPKTNRLLSSKDVARYNRQGKAVRARWVLNTRAAKGLDWTPKRTQFDSIEEAQRYLRNALPKRTLSGPRHLTPEGVAVSRVGNHYRLEVPEQFARYWKPKRTEFSTFKEAQRYVKHAAPNFTYYRGRPVQLLRKPSKPKVAPKKRQPPKQVVDDAPARQARVVTTTATATGKVAYTGARGPTRTVSAKKVPEQAAEQTNKIVAKQVAAKEAEKKVFLDENTARLLSPPPRVKDAVGKTSHMLLTTSRGVRRVQPVRNSLLGAPVLFEAGKLKEGKENLITDPFEITQTVAAIGDELADFSVAAFEKIKGMKNIEGHEILNIYEGMARMALKMRDPKVLKETAQGLLEAGSGIVIFPFFAAHEISENGVANTLDMFADAIADDVRFRWQPVVDGDWDAFEQILESDGHGGAAWYLLDFWPAAALSSRAAKALAVGGTRTLGKDNWAYKQLTEPRPDLRYAGASPLGGGARELVLSDRFFKTIQQRFLDEVRRRRYKSKKDRGKDFTVVPATENEVVPLFQGTGPISSRLPGFSRGGILRRETARSSTRHALLRNQAMLQLRDRARRILYTEMSRGVNRKQAKVRRALVAYSAWTGVARRARPEQTLTEVHETAIKTLTELKHDKIEERRTRALVTGRPISKRLLQDDEVKIIDEIINEINLNGHKVLDERTIRLINEYEDLTVRAAQLDPQLGAQQRIKGIYKTQLEYFRNQGLIDDSAVTQALNALGQTTMARRYRHIMDQDVQRVNTVARKQGLAEPFYYPSVVRRDLRAGGEKARVRRDDLRMALADLEPGTKENILFRLGIQDISPKVGLEGIERNISRMYDTNRFVEALMDFGYSMDDLRRLSGSNRQVTNRNDVMDLLRKGEVKFNQDSFYIVRRGKVVDKIVEKEEADYARLAAEGKLTKIEGQDASLLELLKSELEETSKATAEFSELDEVYVVPKEAVDELMGSFRDTDRITANLWDFSKSTAARMMLGGANLSWAQFQIYANAVLAGIAGVGPRAWFEGNRKIKSLPVEQQRSIDMILNVARHEIDTNRMNRALGEWYAFYRESDWRRKFLRGHDLLDPLFMFDQANNRFFRKAVIWNRMKKEAYRNMNKRGARIIRAMDKVFNIKGGKMVKSFDDAIADVTRDPRTMNRIARDVNDFLGDYMSFTKVERAALNRSVMFYGFLRHSLQFTLWTLPVKHPIRLGVLAKLSKLAVDDEKEFMFGNNEQNIPMPQLGVFHIKGPVELPGIGLFGSDGINEFNLQRASVAGNMLFEARNPLQVLGATNPFLVRFFEAFIFSQNLYRGNPLRLTSSPAYEQEPTGTFEYLPEKTAYFIDGLFQMLRPYRMATEAASNIPWWRRPDHASLLLGKIFGDDQLNRTFFYEANTTPSDTKRDVLKDIASWAEYKGSRAGPVNLSAPIYGELLPFAPSPSPLRSMTEFRAERAVEERQRKTRLAARNKKYSASERTLSSVLSRLGKQVDEANEQQARDVSDVPPWQRKPDMTLNEGVVPPWHKK